MSASACNGIEKQKPRYWIHPTILKREIYGEFYHLFPDLLEDGEKLFKYFRMSSTKFYELILPLLFKKQDTNLVKVKGNREGHDVFILSHFNCRIFLTADVFLPLIAFRKASLSTVHVFLQSETIKNQY